MAATTSQPVSTRREFPELRELPELQELQPPRRRSVVLDLWHLLSLDAPSVAVLWTWFIARANHLRLPTTTLLAMALAVWILYAADRLLDAQASRSHSATHPFDLEARHLFHNRHARSFCIGIGLSSLALAALLPHLAPSAIPLYLVLGALLLSYFALVHTSNRIRPRPSRPVQRLPKELAVGIFFSAATFIPTIARQPTLRLDLLPTALLFALLCSLNCLFIFRWEHPQSTRPQAHIATRPHPATALFLRHLHPLTTLAIVAGLLLAASTRVHPLTPWPIPTAIALAAALLLLLDRSRHYVAPTSLRAASDLCLLTPLLLLPFLS